MNEYGPETLKDWVLGTRDDGDVGMAHVSAWAADRARIAALERRLTGATFEAMGYLGVVNARKPPDAAIVVSVGFMRRVAALAAGEESE